MGLVVAEGAFVEKGGAPLRGNLVERSSSYLQVNRISRGATSLEVDVDSIAVKFLDLRESGPGTEFKFKSLDPRRIAYAPLVVRDTLGVERTVLVKKGDMEKIQSLICKHDKEAALSKVSSEELRELSVDLLNGKDVTAKISGYWTRINSLKGDVERAQRSRREFVELFSRDEFPQFKRVRHALAGTIFRPHPLPKQEWKRTFQHREVVWLAPKEKVEILSQVAGPEERMEVLSQGFYFHSTKSPESLEQILKSELRVSHKGRFQGAFVSTRPEPRWGGYILVFKKNIEFGSSVNRVEARDDGACWIGFHKALPVDEESLAYIINVDNSEIENGDLARKCSEWAGRDIPVVSLAETREYIDKLQGIEEGIPSHWTIFKQGQ